MPLTDEQEDALDAFTDAFDDPGAAAEALQDNAQPIYQEAYDEGHQDGLGEAEGKAGRYKEQRDELEQELEAKEEELEQLREEAPDAAELREQWEESELQPVKEELSELREERERLQRERALSDVERRIRDEVQTDWVAEKLVEDAKERVDTGGEEPRFLRPDGQTPYKPGGDQDAADLFADDLLQSVPEDLRAPQREDGGSDFGGTDGPSGPGRKPKSEYSRSERAEFYEQMRQEGKDPNEEWDKLPEE
mgnify:CR=1 FL=1